MAVSTSSVNADSSRWIGFSVELRIFRSDDNTRYDKITTLYDKDRRTKHKLVQVTIRAI